MQPKANSEAPLSRWWIIPTLGMGVLVSALMSKIVPFAVAEALGICTGVSFAVVVAIWAHRYERWFWPFIIASVAFQGAAVSLIRWPANHVFQKSDLIFVWIDFLVLLMIGVLTERLVSKRRSA